MPEISILHIVGTIFILFAWSRAYLRFREDSMSATGFILWSVIWAGVLVVLFLPQTTEIIAVELGIGRGIDAVVYFAIVLLFYLVYKIYVKIESMEREITKIVREESLRDLPRSMPQSTPRSTHKSDK